MATQIKFIETVWWYPPNIMTQYPGSVISTNIDQYGMVNLGFKIDALTAGNDRVTSLASFFTGIENLLGALIGGGQNIIINMTPQAFTTWYKTSSTFSNYPILSGLYNQLTSSNAETNAANLVAAAGLNWMKATDWVKTSYFDASQFTAVDVMGSGNGLANQEPNCYVLYDPGAVMVSVPDLPWYVYGAILAALLIIIIGFAAPALHGAGAVASAVPTPRKHAERRRDVERSEAQLREQKAKTAKAEKETKQMGAKY
ncbi:MAG: hypothetical protein ABSD73_12310 [Candidatus Bathyarchaeia archaeon]